MGHIRVQRSGTEGACIAPARGQFIASVLVGAVPCKGRWLPGQRIDQDFLQRMNRKPFLVMRMLLLK